MKKFEYVKENFRLLAHLISAATSGSMFTKLLNDGGWSAELTAAEVWQLAKKSKEDYLYGEFVKMAEMGRVDILDFIVEKVVVKDPIYFKIGQEGYKFPRDAHATLRKKIGKPAKEPKKKNEQLFSDRKMHPSVVFAAKRLFKDGHFSQAIFEVCKLLNKRVQEVSGLDIDGKALMLTALSANNPKVRINRNISTTDKDEQEGFMHIFAGVMHGIRNPKGHEIYDLRDPIRALEYLSMLSLLFRKLDETTKLDADSTK